MAGYWGPDAWLGLLLIVTVYLLPTIIAAYRRVTLLPIVLIVNVTCGWTFVGWFVALGAAVLSSPEDRDIPMDSPALDGWEEASRWKGNGWEEGRAAGAAKEAARLSRDQREREERAARKASRQALRDARRIDAQMASPGRWGPAER